MKKMYFTQIFLHGLSWQTTWFSETKDPHLEDSRLAPNTLPQGNFANISQFTHNIIFSPFMYCTNDHILDKTCSLLIPYKYQSIPPGCMYISELDSECLSPHHPIIGGWGTTTWHKNNAGVPFSVSYIYSLISYIY